ncbi:phosphate ABC transporter substrate-binding protein [Vibrio alginolyticus]|uniref:phosphate ABC transporter substrate-binding protein n=1 Tax=Vibrio TaxID=662 RepID=UPI001558984C|nr:MULTISPECIES: phosphate ABC transporter substrate-binding protein [Vibrio]EHK9546811.1 phosphate ABC transporter substrate-binding protein [Vibrio alginolyticus]EHK9602264.1 phosphate ABC transporter substrate-binding protein [Vibrio alginolyticus]EKZ8662717.1 phosphate ABC transporter substrate-binding protein [Vibrio alginolyticus]ELA6640834.1 phosphate ABC transporter substrate-binding protein [Vibrio alginolyticus]ELB2935427.1 phosphate ABC transporter substrate-binding protein [Vibrio 
MKIKVLPFLALTSCLISPLAFSDSEARTSIFVEPEILETIETLIDEPSVNVALASQSGGFNDMLNDGTSIAITSKKWSDENISRFQRERGHRPTRLFLMANTIVVINSQKSTVDSFSVSELKRCDANTYAFGDMRLSNPDVSSNGCQSSIQMLDEDRLKRALSDDLSAKAYMRYSDFKYSEQWSSYKALSVHHNDDSCSLSTDCIYSLRYPFSVVYYVYINKQFDTNQKIKKSKLFELLTTDNNTQQVRNAGFIPLPKALIKINRVKLGLDEPVVLNGYK